MGIDKGANHSFWSWFVENLDNIRIEAERSNNFEIESKILTTKLRELRDDCMVIGRKKPEGILELIFSADGNLQHFAFIEQLVEDAPGIEGLDFIALKPEHNIEKSGVVLNGITYSKDNLHFIENRFDDLPDEIDISIIHPEVTDENRNEISKGVCVFLDNFLGENKFATTIDFFDVVNPEEAGADLIPIEKLKAYLLWREKEFVEKYDDAWYTADDEDYSSLEAETDDGTPVYAIMNMSLLKWGGKASHPWMFVVNMNYSVNEQGLPDDNTAGLLDEVELKIAKQLTDSEGYLNIGQQAVKGVAEVYLACKDFRKPSLVFDQLVEEYGKSLLFSYELFKDKYWQTLQQYINL